MRCAQPHLDPPVGSLVHLAYTCRSGVDHLDLADLSSQKIRAVETLFAGKSCVASIDPRRTARHLWGTPRLLVHQQTLAYPCCPCPSQALTKLQEHLLGHSDLLSGCKMFSVLCKGGCSWCHGFGSGAGASSLCKVRACCCSAEVPAAKDKIKPWAPFLRMLCACHVRPACLHTCSLRRELPAFSVDACQMPLGARNLLPTSHAFGGHHT